MSDEIKACPFCEDRGVRVDADGYVNTASGKYAACNDDVCFPLGSRIPLETWQSRPIEDKLRRQLEDAQARIVALTTDLENARVEHRELIGRHIHEINRKNERIADLVKTGFALTYHINQSITYDNEEEARKGNYGLPLRVINEMNDFIQLLHDNDDTLRDTQRNK